MFNIDFKSEVDLKLSTEIHAGMTVLETGVPYLKAVEEDGTQIYDAYGEITIGSFTEGFRAPLFYWSTLDYQLQWRGALFRIVSGMTKRSALFTKVYDPSQGELFEWWPMYCEGEVVHFQNHMLPTDRLIKPFDFKCADDFVQPREIVDDEGHKISEWSICLAELKTCPLLKG